MKHLFLASVFTIFSISSSFANLPLGSLEYSDNAHNCVLSIQPRDGQTFDIMFDIFEPQMILDGGSENLFTLHQDGPDEAMLSSNVDQIEISWANSPGTNISSIKISGEKTGTCSDLVLRSQIVK